jgi:hypothetical protein
LLVAPEGERLGAAQINKCNMIAGKLELKLILKLLDIASYWRALRSNSSKE